MATMTKEQKREAINEAWAEYRAASQAIPLTTPYSGSKRAGRYVEGFLEIDERLWRQYLAAERQILSASEKAAA